MESVAPCDIDGACERAGQHHFTSGKILALGGQPVGEPCDAIGRMIENAGGDAGLLDLAVAEQQRADPAQISIVRTDRPTAHDQRRIRRVVGDRIHYLPRRPGFGIEAMHPGFQDFECRA